MGVTSSCMFKGNGDLTFNGSREKTMKMIISKNMDEIALFVRILQI